MSKKIIKFKQDADSLIDRANSRFDKGNYPLAINYLFKAQAERPRDTDITLEIALLYGEMGLFDHELRVLIRLLSMGRRDSEIYKELIKCYFEMDLYEQAFFFYKEALKTGALDDDNIEEILEFDFDDDFSSPALRDNRDNTSLMQLSHKLMLSGDLDFAKQLMETISHESYQYIDATNSLAVIALASDMPELAFEYSQKALAVDCDNVHAISHSIISCDTLGDVELREEYTKRLLDLNLSKLNELCIAAFSMQKIGNNEMALHFLEKATRLSPYARENLITCAIANANCGKLLRARELIVRAKNIYPDDITIDFYSKRILEADEKTDLEIFATLPQSVSDCWTKELEAFIKNRGEAKAITQDLRIKILWAFQGDDWRLQALLGARIVKFTEWEKFIRGLLIDPYFDYRPKKECLQALLNCAKTKKFDLFIADTFFSFDPKIPRGVYPEEMRHSYWQVYTTLAFISSSFDTKLNKAFKQLISCYNDEQFVKFKIDSRVMSALLLYRVSMRHVFKTKVDCCEVFGCDMTDFEVYNDIFSTDTVQKENKKNVTKHQRKRS